MFSFLIQKDTIRVLRKWVVILFMIVFYLLFSYTVITGKTWLVNFWWISFFFLQFLFLCGFLLSFHLSAIDLKKYNRAWLELIFLWSLVLQVLYIWWMPFGDEVYVWYRIFVFLALIVFHIGILFLISDKWTMFRTRRTLSSWDIVVSGVANFALFIAVSLSLLAAGTWQSLPVSCGELYNSMGSFIQRLASPVFLWVEKASALWEWLKHLSETTFGEIIWIDEQKADIIQKQLSSLEKNKNTESGGLLAEIEEWKLFILEEAADKSKINQGVCEVIVNQINTKAKTSKFKYSAAILLFFLLYPLVRFFFFMVSVGSFIFFKILHRSRLYTWKKVMKEVEEIE